MRKVLARPLYVAGTALAALALGLAVIGAPFWVIAPLVAIAYFGLLR